MDKGWICVCGVANSTTVNSGGSIYVDSGGTANSTTVNSGWVEVNGGVVNSITVNSGCSVDVYWGTVNSTTVNSGCSVDVYCGTVNSTTVNSGGSVYVAVGGGGTANHTTVNSGGFLSADGTANHTTVNSGGIYIFCCGFFDGGMANHTTVNSGGSMLVSGGGMATGIDAQSGAYLGLTLAPNTYIAGQSNGSSFVIQNGKAHNIKVNSGWVDVSSGGLADSTTINGDSFMLVSSGGTANSTTVNDGWLEISIDGTANSTTVNSGGSVYVAGDGGTANHTTVNSGGYLSVGGVANHTTVNSGGYLSVGGVANHTTVNSGGLLIVSSGGTANSTTVNSGGVLNVSSGGTLEGDLLLGGKMTTYGKVTATDAKIVYDLTQRLPEEEIMVDNLANLAGASYSISVLSDQQKGIYKLAGNAANFTSDVTLTVNDTVTGSFVWNGNGYDSIELDGQSYSLNLNAANELCFGLSTQAEDIPDQVLEILARETIYSDHKVDEKFSVLCNDKEYFFKVSVIGTDDTGFYAIGLQRTDESWESLGQAIVLCRGTEKFSIEEDWKDDFNRNGVGIGQFQGTGALQIKAWLAKEEIHSQELYFSGHSLGGALAQRFAVYYHNTNYMGAKGDIGGCVTFNSPGINGNSMISAKKVHHYIIDGDLISLVGDGYVYGDSNSDSWYAKYKAVSSYDDSFIENPSLYFANCHSDSWVSETELIKKDTNMAKLANSDFSYIGAFDDCNEDYMRFALSLGIRYEKANRTNVLCSEYYDSFFTGKYEFDISVSNKLTTRSRTEAFRKEYDKQYLYFWYTIFGEPFQLLQLSPNVLKLEYAYMRSGIDVGNRILKSSDGKNHDIRTLEWSNDSDNLPDLLYDFTDKLFMTVEKFNSEFFLTSLDNSGKSEISLYLCISNTESTDSKWRYFSIPFEQIENSERYSMTSISRAQSTNQTSVSLNNLITIDEKLYLFDDSGVTDYLVKFSVDKNVTQETAVITPTIQNLQKGDSALDILVTNIDSSKSAGGGNDVITVTVSTSSGAGGTATLQLQELEMEGIFSGTLNMDGVDGLVVVPGEPLVISYLDEDNGKGEQELVRQEIPVLLTDVALQIDERGLETGFEVITEDVAWYKFNLLVDSNTLAGQYVLAENLGNASGDCVVWGYDSEASAALLDGADVRIDANTFTKQIVDDRLVLEVKTAPRTIRWTEIENAAGYVVEFSQDDFESVLQVHCNKAQVDLLNLPNGEYRYRIRTLETDGWQFASTVTVKNNVAAEQRLADADTNKDLFFGNVRGVWSSDYQAQHVGVGEWSGTGQTVALKGKNVIADIFSGSDDASILLLTDDENGDALFLDDIYSLFPEGMDAQARLARINEIVAGAGADVIDLTSQRFKYLGGGMAVHGGLGDDVIWANSGENLLFGDAGKDRIVGASGNDTIVGGAGDDLLHGGGGNDLFVFGGKWGKDTVEQLATGKVTLWFKEGDESKWDESMLTYTDGDNSVKVSGVTKENISLKFGNEDAQYSDLLAAGAFDEFTSEKIFEDKNKGLLA
ncbi:MAG: AIDA repeat-containing protein [Victivallales bacterium]|nr:AIDA repeat-containing protein [Victivallales bacterium]